MSGVGDASNETGIDQTDHCDEHANADTHCGLDFAGDGVEYRHAEPGKREGHDDNTVEDDEPHGLGPGETFGGNEGDCNKGVDAQAGGNTEGVFGNGAEGDGHNAGGEGGGCCNLGNTEDGAVTVGAGTEDEGVEDDDVGHCEECDYTSADLGAHGGAAFGDLEVAVEGTWCVDRSGFCHGYSCFYGGVVSYVSTKEKYCRRYFCVLVVLR